MAHPQSPLDGPTFPAPTPSSWRPALTPLERLGHPYGWVQGGGDWQGVARAATQMQPVAVVQTVGWDLWREELPEYHSLLWLQEEDLIEENGAPGDWSAVLWMSDRRAPTLPMPVAAWHPRTLWLGIGCERGTPAEVIQAAIATALASQNLAWEAIAGLASLDRKAHEASLLSLAETFDWPTRWYGAEQLAAIAPPNPSPTVAGAVGTGSVAEAAAIAAVSQGPRPGPFWQTLSNAAPERSLVVEKQIYRGEGGACTVAIARAEVEYNARPGHLTLVDWSQDSPLPPEVATAVAQADAVLGSLAPMAAIDPLLQPAQMVEATPSGQVRQRAERAIALIQRGLRVVVVSAVDGEDATPANEATARLVLDALAQGGWNGQVPTLVTLGA